MVAESHEERLPSGICPSCRMYIENCDCFDDDPDEPYEFGEDDAFMEEEEATRCPACDVQVVYGESHDSECPYA